MKHARAFMFLMAHTAGLVFYFLWYTEKGFRDSIVRMESQQNRFLKPQSGPYHSSGIPQPLADNLSWAIFTLPKPFRKAPKQYAAIYSWTKLRNTPRKIYICQASDLTNEEVDEIRQRIPQIQILKTGFRSNMTMRLDSVFERASREPLDAVVFLNSDIVLFDDFPAALAHLAANFPRFFMVGSRYDGPTNTSMPPWSDLNVPWLLALRNSTDQGVLHTYGGSDYFAWRPMTGPTAASTAIGSRIPAFSIGRPKVIVCTITHNNQCTALN
jgi:hypothetical protein